MRNSKAALVELTFLLTLVVLLGCSSNSIFSDPNLNSGLDVIVAKQEQASAWTLSPTGDKLVYRTNNPTGLFLLDTQTQQKYNLDNNICERFRWLDDTLLLCTNHKSESIVFTNDNLRTIPLHRIEEQDENFSLSLDDKEIYRFKEEPVFIVIAENYVENPDKNYYVIVQNEDEFLQDRNVIIIPDPGWQPPLTQLGEKLSSPNQEFYFTKITQNSVAIHKATNGEKVSEFSDQDPNVIQVIGWAADSSGVYVALIPGGMFNDSRNSLYKLKVP